METQNFNTASYDTSGVPNQWENYGGYDNQTTGYETNPTTETLDNTINGQMGQTAMETYNTASYAQPETAVTEEASLAAATEIPSASDTAELMNQLENLGDTNVTTADTAPAAEAVAASVSAEVETPATPEAEAPAPAANPAPPLENLNNPQPTAEAPTDIPAAETTPDTATTDSPSAEAATAANTSTAAETATTATTETAPKTAEATLETSVSPEERQQEIASALEKITELSEAVENAVTSEAAVLANIELWVHQDFYGEISQPDNLETASAILDKLQQKYLRLAKAYAENGHHTDSESFYAQADKANRLKSEHGDAPETKAA